jgi:hypothetical protein
VKNAQTLCDFHTKYINTILQFYVPFSKCYTKVVSKTHEICGTSIQNILRVSARWHSELCNFLFLCSKVNLLQFSCFLNFKNVSLCVWSLNIYRECYSAENREETHPDSCVRTYNKFMNNLWKTHDKMI